MEAIKKRFEIDLDVKRSTTSRSTNKVKQGDNGNVFAINLTHDGEPIDLTGTKVLVVFSKTDGTAQQDTDGHGVTIDPEKSNRIIVEVYTTSFAPGLVECEVQIFSGEGFNTLITSARFNFECDKAIMNDETVQATNEYPILADLIETVREVERELEPIEQNENDRVNAEEDRIAAETERTEAEIAREQAELLREQEEADRITDEQIRIGNEETRNNAENQRYVAESGRASAENARATAEQARVSAESSRASAETSRVDAEKKRASAESTRASNEAIRVSAENARAAAEIARESKWSKANATATTLSEGSAATASATINANGLTLSFGIPTGPRGLQGERGERGLQGIRGETGATGSRGATFTPSLSDGYLSWANDGGLANPPAAYIRGPQGIQGVKGDTGSGFVVLGYYATVSALSSSVTSPNAGDAYGVGAVEPYDIYIWDGVNRKWVNNGPLQGAKGDTGPAGKDGVDGSPGPAGSNGSDGVTFTPSVSSDGTLSWTNNGSLANPASVNIRGPIGPIGPTGPAGADGSPGVTGSPGKDGYTPVKYTDYWTADKAEMVADVLAALPTYGGEVNEL